MDDLFIKASRKRFRFESKRGLLTTEQLWDLALISDGFDLDDIAKTVNAELKEVSEESFVKTVNSPRKADLETKLEIVKTIIAVKLAEAEAAKNHAEKVALRTKFLDAVAAKDDEAIKGMSRDELMAKLAELDA